MDDVIKKAQQGMGINSEYLIWCQFQFSMMSVHIVYDVSSDFYDACALLGIDGNLQHESNKLKKHHIMDGKNAVPVKLKNLFIFS